MRLIKIFELENSDLLFFFMSIAIELVTIQGRDGSVSSCFGAFCKWIDVDVDKVGSSRCGAEAS